MSLIKSKNINRSLCVTRKMLYMLALTDIVQCPLKEQVLALELQKKADDAWVIGIHRTVDLL